MYSPDLPERSIPLLQSGVVRTNCIGELPAQSFARFEPNTDLSDSPDCVE